MPSQELPSHKWTMAIDLDKCTGCNACVVACHAENNVPIANDDEVANHRGIHWIRVERYWQGEGEEANAHFLINLCQQCTNAPCEPVCPTYASVHSDRQNLNLQVYNRCVGTRYCGNNDPYKVRFFNYYAPQWDSPLEQQLNPDVTVRSAGVMEKCTFCVQRIRRAEIQALAEGRNIRTGEMVPACVQTCPPQALLFGDLNDPNSQVQGYDQDNRQFRLLGFLGTAPNIVYLKEGKTNG
ncbi:MAG: 4Fe-4S dicluster domain-containing protein [Anaerolineae bacterium]